MWYVLRFVFWPIASTHVQQSMTKTTKTYLSRQNISFSVKAKGSRSAVTLLESDNESWKQKISLYPRRGGRSRTSERWRFPWHSRGDTKEVEDTRNVASVARTVHDCHVNTDKWLLYCTKHYSLWDGHSSVPLNTRIAYVQKLPVIFSTSLRLTSTRVSRYWRSPTLLSVSYSFLLHLLSSC